MMIPKDEKQDFSRSLDHSIQEPRITQLMMNLTTLWGEGEEYAEELLQ